MQLYADRALTQAIGSPLELRISDSSIDPTISSSKLNLREGEAFSVSVSDLKLPAIHPVYLQHLWDKLSWKIEGVGIDSSDFSAGSIAGEINLRSESSTLDFAIAEDLKTEGGEEFTFKLFYNHRYPEPDERYVEYQVGETINFTIGDTSASPISYSLKPDLQLVSEEGKIRTNVSTTGVAEGTRLY